MKHIWHKNMQKGRLKLLAPFKEQDVPNDRYRQCPKLWLVSTCLVRHGAKCKMLFMHEA